MKGRRITACLLLLAGIGLMIHSGGWLIETEQIYREGNAAYEGLSNQVRKRAERNGQTPQAGTKVEEAPSSENMPDAGLDAPQAGLEAPPAQTAQVYIPQIEIDFEALRAISEDTAAWLYCPDTVIDYPVMKADDYSYYLHRLPDGTKNANGSLFIDYNCAPDFSDPLTVIYGHHMKSGRMFGSLKGYKDQRHYEEHPYMYLYTRQENYQIDLIYGCVIGEGKWRERAFMYAENVRALMAYAAHNTTFVSDVAYMEGDRVVALSTCSYEFDDARYVVLGILRAEYEEA